MALAGRSRLAVLVISGDVGGACPAAPGLADDRHEGLQMCNLNEWIVREAFLAYDGDDVAALMDFVDLGLEWTYLDPGPGNPQPRICHGRGELERALRRLADRGLRAELEEVIASGDQVILVMRTPGVDEYRQRRAEDRTYDVATVRDGMIVGLQACRDRSEARSLAGIG
jgi:ketosteroid isomerase-like protein